MSDVSRVIRLDPQSPMSAWESISHDGVVDGELKERRHDYFKADRSDSGSVKVGLWEASAYTERVVDYPCDELMVILEGSVTIIHEDGQEESFKVGDVLFMPRGFTGYWKQDEPMKKIFMWVSQP